MRVLTVNLWARNGPYAIRERLLRDGVNLLAPDLLALQEVDSGPGDINQAIELFAELGYAVDYERQDGENKATPGIAIAATLPIIERQLIELPHGGAALAVRVNSVSGPLWFCCAKPMPWLPGHEAAREDEVVALDAELTKLALHDAIPPILAGDFDATPDSASMRFLAGLQSLNGRSTFWWDAWQAAGDASPGYTWSSNNPYTAPYPAKHFGRAVHHRRIDYILIGSPFRWVHPVAISSCQITLTNLGSDAASDHYGVFADLALD